MPFSPSSSRHSSPEISLHINFLRVFPVSTVVVTIVAAIFVLDKSRNTSFLAFCIAPLIALPVNPVAKLRAPAFTVSQPTENAASSTVFSPFTSETQFLISEIPPTIPAPQAACTPPALREIFPISFAVDSTGCKRASIASAFVILLFLRLALIFSYFAIFSSIFLATSRFPFALTFSNCL